MENRSAAPLRRLLPTAPAEEADHKPNQAGVEVARANASQQSDRWLACETWQNTFAMSPAAAVDFNAISIVTATTVMQVSVARRA
jgi:hypothetical protein